jgi:endonuclease-8
MAEGDTILRLARRIDQALAGEALEVVAPNPRGRVAGVDRLDGMVLAGARARGKNLLLDFGELLLHSHLGMSGSWHLYRPGERWRKPRPAAWVVLRGKGAEAVQWGGPTLRVLTPSRLRHDPGLGRLGPDILARDVDACTVSLRESDQGRALGEALLDQGLVAGIGNIFKSEGCFAAKVNPWRPLAEIDDEELRRVIGLTARLMQEAAAGGGHPGAIYRRAGQPCAACGAPISSRGQGDANRTTYWCERCQE